jgi:hypothetical protein
VNGAQFIYASTCYLDEWVDLPEFLQAYRQFNHSDEALLHLHIDGSNAAISVMQKNSINRNRELIRQHLLLAHASGRLVQEAGHYQLQVSEKSKALDFQYRAVGRCGGCTLHWTMCRSWLMCMSTCKMKKCSLKRQNK